MPEQEALSSVERFLREVVRDTKGTPEEDPALEEVADLLTDLQTDDAQVVYRCNVHEQHRGSVPLMEVVRTFDHFKYARLECGHKIFYDGPDPGPATYFPCVHCMEDCHT